MSEKYPICFTELNVDIGMNFLECHTCLIFKLKGLFDRHLYCKNTLLFLSLSDTDLKL